MKRVILSMPPQHAKSDTITRRLPVYWGERFPGDNVLLTGYSQTFAESQLSLPARDLAAERGTLGAATALNFWKFSNGGSVSVRGVGAPPTGLPRLKLIIVDDPVSSREDAESETMREKVWQWWTGTIVQRFWMDTRAIIIATRWHEDDLIGRLIADQPDKWTVINLAAIAEEGDDLGRPIGEALWPALKPIHFLEAQKIEMGEYEFEALFQGNPTPREGSFFKIGNLQIVDVIPPLKKVARAWDIAHTEGGGDFTVGAKVGACEDGRFIVLDVRRGQWDTDERDKIIKDTASTDGHTVKIHGPQDPGGKSWAKVFTRMLAGYTVKTDIVRKDKQLRADPVSSQVNAGNFLILRGTWNNAFIEELRQFPNGKYDDQVDAFGDGFMEVLSDRSAIITTTQHVQPIVVPQLTNTMAPQRNQRRTEQVAGLFRVKR